MNQTPFRDCISDSISIGEGTSISFKKRNARGMTLIEVIIASLAFAIAALGSATMFSYARGQVHRQQRRREAVQLAVQALEQLKAGDYLSIQDGQVQQTVVLQGVSFTRTTTAADTGTFKTLQVAIGWDQGGRRENIVLETILSPQ